MNSETIFSSGKLPDPSNQNISAQCDSSVAKTTPPVPPSALCSSHRPPVPHDPLSLLSSTSSSTSHFTHPPSLPVPLLFAGDGDDNRPGMRGGHQMVIDVQTGETHAASVMTWLFNQRCDSYPPTQTQNSRLYYCLIKLTPLPPGPPTSSPPSLKEICPKGISFLRAHKS